VATGHKGCTFVLSVDPQIAAGQNIIFAGQSFIPFSLGKFAIANIHNSLCQQSIHWIIWLWRQIAKLLWSTVFSINVQNSGLYIPRAWMTLRKPQSHRLFINVLLTNIFCYDFFAVFDVSFFRSVVCVSACRLSHSTNLAKFFDEFRYHLVDLLCGPKLSG